MDDKIIENETEETSNTERRQVPFNAAEADGKHCFVHERRKFDRRTRRDRRRVWKNPKYKGPERRRMKRRCMINRRHVGVTIDDLGKNIP
jgi:hypothetical protein